VGVSPWTDGAQAMHGAYAILSAIYYHRWTGKGQYIDAAMIEGSANFLGELVMSNIINGCQGELSGNRDAAMAPHGCYPCRDTQSENEWIAIAVANQKEWLAMVKLMGSPAWSGEDEYADELSRWKNQTALDTKIAAWTRRFGSYELAEKLQKAGIAATPSLSTKQATHDKHLNERGFFVKTHHPVLGDVTLTGLPFRMSDSPRGNYKRAPLLGEDNNYVFGELLGYTTQEIEQLATERVLS
jgi:crotonobetainyl-CoA:carnitine CoA-transferase CaiB-like acyl-CoA transferase